MHLGPLYHVANSDPGAKFGPQCNYNWRSYPMCIRIGPLNLSLTPPCSILSVFDRFRLLCVN